MTSISQPICMFCKHYKPGGEKFTCAAFPDGIPDSIIDSLVDHRQPFVGDNGIQFEAKTRAGTAYAKELFAEAVR